MDSKVNFKNNYEPSVDVILTNFNKANFIEESIQSVINQAYKNWKLYIIDDNSNDKSLEIINKFSDFKKIIIVNLSKNKNNLCRYNKIQRSH